MIKPKEISTPHLDLPSKAALMTAINVVDAGLMEVTVSMTYRKQTRTRKRLAGEDYVGMPGVTMASQIGILRVLRRVNSERNRRAGVAGKVYFRVVSCTRANGVDPAGFTNIRPEGITAFVVLGARPLVAQRTS